MRIKPLRLPSVPSGSNRLDWLASCQMVKGASPLGRVRKHVVNRQNTTGP